MMNKNDVHTIDIDIDVNKSHDEQATEYLNKAKDLLTKLMAFRDSGLPIELDKVVGEKLKTKLDWTRTDIIEDEIVKALTEYLQEREDEGAIHSCSEVMHAEAVMCIPIRVVPDPEATNNG